MRKALILVPGYFAVVILLALAAGAILLFSQGELNPMECGTIVVFGGFGATVALLLLAVIHYQRRNP